MDEQRINEIYERLVEETDNPLTIHDRMRNGILKSLLEVFEYLRGEENKNPMNDIFWEQ
jgi:hypothetical protein